MVPPHPSPPGRSIALWGLTKKKPLAVAREAHGVQDAQGLQQPYWISAVAALRNSDLLATGAWRPLRSRALGRGGGCPAPLPRWRCMAVSSLCPRLPQCPCEALEVR